MRRSLRRPVLVVLLLLLPLVLPGCQADEERMAEHMSRGDAYFEDDKVDEAIIEYKNVLQIDPNHAPAHFGLARCFLKKRKPRDAFWELRETVRLDSGHVRGKLQLAQILIFGGEFEEALGHIEEVIAKEPGKAESLILRAQALEGLKRPEDALASYKEAVALDPEDPGPITLLAYTYGRRGERDLAEAEFRRVTELKPDFNSYTALGRFLVRGNDRARDPDVEAALEKALELAEGEQRPQAYIVLGNFYFSRERYDEAMSTLEAGIAAEEDTLDMIYALARFHHALGDEAKADEMIEQATEAAPDQARPYLILSAYRDRKGDVAGALAAAEKAIEVEPESKEAQLRMAEVLIEKAAKEEDKEAVAEGRRIVEELLVKEPTNPGGLLIKAKVDLFEAKLDDAVDALRKAIDAKPDWAQAHFVLGTVLALQREDTAARAELARALEIDASMVDARKMLAQVHARLGENEYAVEEGRRYLRENPDDPATRVLVAQSLMRLDKRADAVRELNAIPEESRNAEVYYAFGRVQMSVGNFDESRAYLMQALDLMPTNHDILRSLLQIDQVQGRFDESVTRVAAAVEQEPENAKLHQLQGMISIASGDPDAGEQSLKRAIELDPNDMSSYEQLALYYRSVNRLEDTIKTYEAAVEKRPDTARFHHLLATLYEAGLQYDMAIERYEEAIKHDPNLAASKNNLAYLYAERKENLDRALDLAQEAKALMPESAHAADTLGWVLLQRDIPAAAISYLKEAEAGLNPNSSSLATVQYHLALAYEKNGDPEMARQMATKALDTLEAQNSVRQSQGIPNIEPKWANQARDLLERLPAVG